MFKSLSGPVAMEMYKLRHHGLCFEGVFFICMWDNFISLLNVTKRLSFWYFSGGRISYSPNC